MTNFILGFFCAFVFIAGFKGVAQPLPPIVVELRDYADRFERHVGPFKDLDAALLWRSNFVHYGREIYIPLMMGAE